MASMASSAWLVTTTSASLARSRAISAKHSAPYAHFEAPRHSREDTDTWAQARSETPGVRSSRSPVSVSSRPVAQPQQVLAQLAGGRGRLELVEEALLLVLRHAFVQAVQAQVVRPALEHRELGAAAQQRMQRVDRSRQVALHELALQGQGGRGDDDALPVRERGHQVAERLSGAGAGLDQQMGAVVDRLRDGFGHGHLAGALRTADGSDGGMQEFGE